VYFVVVRVTILLVKLTIRRVGPI